MEPIIRLTTRETDVLQLLAAGHTYTQVGERLGVSANTVASHVKNIYRKLEVHSGRAAVWRALQLRMLGEVDSSGTGAGWTAELMAASLLKDQESL